MDNEGFGTIKREEDSWKMGRKFLENGNVDRKDMK